MKTLVFIQLISRLGGGESSLGLSAAFRKKGSFSLILALILIFCCCLIPTPLQAAVKTRTITEKLIPVVEDQSFFKSEDQNYIFNSPSRLEVAGNQIFVLDTHNDRIQIFDLKGRFLKSIGQRGKGPAEFNSPEGLYIDEKKNEILVADTRNLRLQLLNLAGQEKMTLKLNLAPVAVVRRNEQIYLLAFPATSLIQSKQPLIKIFDEAYKPSSSFFSPIRTDNLIMDLLVNSLIMKSDRRNNLVIARQFALNQVQVLNERNKSVSRFEIIYKGSHVAKPGTQLRVRSDLEIQKIAFLVADISFDFRNNYYFLAGISGQKPDGQPEKGREIYQYDVTGKYLGTIILPFQARLIAFGPDDSLYLIDANYNLRKFKPRKGDWR